MKVNGRQIEYPIVGKLSLFKIKKSLEKMFLSSDVHKKAYAKELLVKLEKVPVLISGTENLDIVEENRALVDELMTVIFPTALTLNEIKGATPPFSFSSFYMSERMTNIIHAAGPDFEMKVTDLDENGLYIMGCSIILMAHFKFPIGISAPLVMEIPEKNGNLRYYRSAFNADLMEIKPTNQSIEISEKDYWELMNNYEDIDLWKNKFPPNSWEVRGLGLINLMDITIDQSINMMTSNLLEGGKGSLYKVVDNIRSLLRIDDLIIGFYRSNYDKIGVGRIYQELNILEDDFEDISFDDVFDKEEYKILVKNKKPLIIPSVEEYAKTSDSFITRKLKSKNIKSYMLVALVVNDDLLAFVEIGSEKERAVNSLVSGKLSLALPILSMAASRFKQEEINRVQAIIQEKCTSIHPSVKWKFERAAVEYFNNESFGEKTEFNDLVFNDVYPLYGQMDISKSSSLRNKAVIEDLSLQLKKIRKILQKAVESESLPAYQEMLFRVSNYLDEFKKDLVEGSEKTILTFLQSEVYPIFDHLKLINATIEEMIVDYQALLNTDTNSIYDKRKAFDESVYMLNRKLSEMLDARQVVAQKMFPHFYERYNTDGVEYNLYIGQSMSEKKIFNRIYLNNLQLWEITTICEMEIELEQFRKELPMSLQVASLILVHNSSLSIHFRVDEKRFDVEGAYNARYEILKKRVDKAHIKGTNERITIPGKIAIVYSTKEDAIIYSKHILYLVAKGYIVPNSIEDLELEDLQGVTGLKALRVTVDYANKEDELNIDELIKSIKKEH